MRNLKTLLLCLLLAILLVLCISPLQDTIDRRRSDELGQSAIAGDVIEKAGPLLLAGFRGVVVDVLWIRAERLKQEEQWYELPELYTYITKLQPNLPSVWEFISWNHAWNIAHEWKAYEDKWKWIRKGIDDAYSGIIRNPENSKLRFWLAYIHAQRFDVKIFREQAEWLEAKYRKKHEEIVRRALSKIEAMPDQERKVEAIQNIRNILEKIKEPKKSNLEVSIAWVEDAVRLKEKEVWEKYNHPGLTIMRIDVKDIKPFINLADPEIAKNIVGGGFVFASVNLGPLVGHIKKENGKIKIKGMPNNKVGFEVSGKKVEVDAESAAKWMAQGIKQKSAVWARTGCRWRDKLVEQLEREADHLEEKFEKETDKEKKKKLLSLLEKKLNEANERAEEALEKWKYHKQNWPDTMHIVPRALQEATVRMQEIKDRIKKLEQTKDKL